MCLCNRMLQNAFPGTLGLLVSKKRKRKKRKKREKKEREKKKKRHLKERKTQRPFFSTLRPLSPVMFSTAIVVAFILLRSSRFRFHCYTHCEATPTQKSTRK